MTFQQKLDALIKKNNSLLCVGLDSDIEKLPVKFRNSRNPQVDFNQFIVQNTHDLVCCYKINSAFYESHGPAGLMELKETCDYIRQKYPHISLILDFKRGDIGNTNEGYVQFAFDYLHVDAVTIHPYMGKDSLEPFLKEKNKGIFILCRTSNPGAGEFQDLLVDGKPLYQMVAQTVTTTWNKFNNCYLVVGATTPEELAKVREIVGDTTILVPGIGSQGGNVEDTVKAGLNSQKSGIIVSASRSIIFGKNPREEAQKLRDEINSFRN
jgi:orotidine-5'-phosphate decarboxylase